MDSVKEYLLSIVAAALICSIVSALTPKESAYSSIIKMICGLFIAVTAITPLIDIEITDPFMYLREIQTEANTAASRGEAMANKASFDIIKSQSEAYILDKASSLGLNIEVEVSLNDSVPPSPYSIIIKGAVSPYQKQKLQQEIKNDLAIPEERQIWN